MSRKKAIHSEQSYNPIPLPDRIELSDEEALRAAISFSKLMAKRHTVRHFSERAVNLSVIEACIRAAGFSPSGANQQPWHFVAIANKKVKQKIRQAAEVEEQHFYAGKGGNEWLHALEPIGTDSSKQHLEKAPWLIVIFAQRYGVDVNGEKYKHYYVTESVGIAVGVLITALHQSGLVSLTHTPNPMRFLNEICDRPKSNRAVMILAAGHPSAGATVPAAAKQKKPLEEILTILLD